MKLKSKWPVRRFFAFLGALYLFCAVTPLLFAESGTAKSESVFRIYDTATETVRTVNDLDFLCGALPCEMAVSAPDEALKAQIIAIHTLYDRKRRENTGKDFDFTCDSAEKSIYTVDAGLTDEEQNRVRALCLSVLDKEIYFENEPINACYFAISAGCTQPFENVGRKKATRTSPLWRARATFWRRGFRARQRLRKTRYEPTSRKFHLTMRREGGSRIFNILTRDMWKDLRSAGWK